MEYFEIEKKENPKLRILLADDEPSVSKFMARALQGMGHEIEVVVNGELLLEKLEKEKGNVDLVITDYDFKTIGMDGIDVIKEIRKTDKDLQIIIYSSHDLAKEIKNVGAQENIIYLEKPFGLEKLRNTIDTVAKEIAERKKKSGKGGEV